jgi:phage/plasmid-associated DNA primase
MLFGEWNVSSTRLDALLDRNIDARMRAMGAIEGKVFNMCQEISGTDIEKGSDVFKSLVSGEPQDVRVIGKNIHTAYDIPYLIFSMNQMPSNRKMDKAFSRRMVRIDFRSSVRREDMDRQLLTKLAGEMSGIRNWVLQGWFKLERDGFSIRPPRESDRMTDEEIEMHIANGQTIDVWLDQWAFLWPSRHIGHDEDEVCLDLRSVDLYRDYASYCENKLDCLPESSNSFGRQMHDRLNFESHRRSIGVYYRVYCDKSNRFNL